ncbi:MAG TPA: SDR family NAD(P)-dependent oxidoreductase [Candidatus Limnocylindrales bacterium]|nr:SDR family NAD(P)-dependent oxidoreductase [Candidatus Limnocylindrales bacterium]
MGRFSSWLRERFSARPLWMNALMLFCAYQVFIYSPFDLLLKPVSRDEDVWLGLVLTGWAAKVGGIVHWIVYALGLYGFWRMRPWMWPWASVYVGQMAFAFLVWCIAYIGGARGWAAGILTGGIFSALAWALWNARPLFRPRAASLVRRYGNWAVITGASAGIGLEFARALAARGFSCVLVARREDSLQRLAEELQRAHDVQTRVVAVDLSEPGGPEKLADSVADLEVGLLVSNAGVGYAGRFLLQDTERLRRMIELNCTGIVVLLSRLLPGMVQRRRGGVIITGSVAGRQPIPFHAVYSATKGFELLLGEGLWLELREQGVDVLVVQPGPVATEFEAVAGEARVDRSAEESPRHVVEVALESLGQQPSVVTTWFNWVRANVSRFAPRTAVAFIAANIMERQTDPEML